uniref:t-SNARE coiled-coil homology domain-containing protein n=1 Tax=Globisporangium ultimum (strain ATCC 200006 / CBS 805.95 / DAOM BR144) TaxID=431595 RepID=K3WKN3_GLOUD
MAAVATPLQKEDTLTIILDLADAKRALPQLRASVNAIETLLSTPNALRSEADYAANVTPKVDAVTLQYQSLARFLQEHKKQKDGAHEKEFRSVQREFVVVMQELQEVQKQCAIRREELCDADFLATTNVTSVDLQVAKEEVVEAGQIASEAAVVKQLFQQVGAIVAEQGKGVDQIQHKVETIRIEIGRGVDELQHAQRLQREAQRKYLYAACLALAIVAIIVVPIVVKLA